MAQPGQRGGNQITNPELYPNSLQSLFAKTQVQEKLRDAGVAASGAEYTASRSVEPCEAFTVYAKGTGGWNVEVSPDPNSGVWVALSGSDKSGDGFLQGQWHTHVRVVIRNGANLEVWLYKKYATY